MARLPHPTSGPFADSGHLRARGARGRRDVAAPDARRAREPAPDALDTLPSEPL